MSHLKSTTNQKKQIIGKKQEGFAKYKSGQTDMDPF